MLKTTVTEEQFKLINDIMEENSLQKKTDKIVANTKFAMEICEAEDQQTKIDKIVAKELEKQ